MVYHHNNDELERRKLRTDKLQKELRSLAGRRLTEIEAPDQKNKTENKRTCARAMCVGIIIMMMHSVEKRKKAGD